MLLSPAKIYKVIKLKATALCSKTDIKKKIYFDLRFINYEHILCTDLHCYKTDEDIMQKVWYARNNFKNKDGVSS